MRMDQHTRIRFLLLLFGIGFVCFFIFLMTLGPRR
jgi:hypothetical protein